MIVNKIFPARAYADYNTEYEVEYINLLKNTYPGTELIKLPKVEEGKNLFGIDLWNKEKERYFKLIDDCDLMTLAPINTEFYKDGRRRPDKGKLSEGQKMEAIYGLSIRKKVYIYRNGQFQEIHDIYQEGLVDEWLKLNKWGCFDKNPDIVKLSQALHKKMMRFYQNNKNVRDILKGFMSSNRTDIECVRPIVIQEKFPIRYDPIDYLPKKTNRNYELKDLGFIDSELCIDCDISQTCDRKTCIKRGKYNVDYLFGEWHFRPCIFDTAIRTEAIDKEVKEVADALKRQEKPVKDFKYIAFDPHVIGVCVTFDIDAPSAKFFTGKDGKIDMYDGDWYEEFMTMKCAAETWFDKVGLKYVCMTTGNGFNVVGEPYWFDERGGNFEKFKKDMQDVAKKLNKKYQVIHKQHIDGEVSNIRGVTIDQYPHTWHLFKKMPFTYHARWQRITFPVAKGRIDKEWLKRMSDLDYFMYDQIKNVEDVIVKSNWDKDKWW